MTSSLIGSSPAPSLEAASPERDAQLVAVLVAGRNEAALKALYVAHAAPVLALARRITGTGFESEDVVQEVFLKLWDEPGRFDRARGSVRSYLLVSARSRSLDFVRARASRERREVVVGRAATTSTDTAELVMDRLDNASVAGLLDVLRPTERESIDLAYFGGLTYRQISAQIGIPEGTVKSRIRLGLGRIRRSVEPADVA